MEEILEEVIEILEGIRPDLDFNEEDNLVDGHVLDSFDIISLIGELNDSFEIEISAKYMVNSNFNSAEAIASMIQEIQEEE